MKENLKTLAWSAAAMAIGVALGIALNTATTKLIAKMKGSSAPATT